MKLNILMVQKQNLINLNWKPTQMVVEPLIYDHSQIYILKSCFQLLIPFIGVAFQSNFLVASSPFGG